MIVPHAGINPFSPFLAFTSGPRSFSDETSLSKASLTIGTLLNRAR